MTLGQFSVAVGAPPKWVQNAFRVLGLSNEYSVERARTMRLVRLIWETCGTELTDAYRLAQEALANSVRGLEWHVQSPDGALAVVFDRERFLSSFAAALGKARVLYNEKRRGRPVRHEKTGMDAAREYGVDVGLIEAMLLLTPADRIRRLERELAYHAPGLAVATRLLSLLEELNRAEVRYVVVGGVAASLHGSVEVPHSLEICYDRRADNLRNLGRLLTRLEAYPRGVFEELPFAMDVVTLATIPSLALTTTNGAIDLTGMVRGIGALDRVEMMSSAYEVDGVAFRALGLGALLKSLRVEERAVERKRLVELEVIQELTAAVGPVRVGPTDEELVSAV